MGSVNAALLGLIASLSDRDGREYVRSEHVPQLMNRFQTHKEYLSSLEPSRFVEYFRVTSEEFWDILDRLGDSLDHPRTHRAPISSDQRLCIFLRYIGHGTSMTALSHQYCCGKSTVSEIIKEVAEAIVDKLHPQAFPPITQEYISRCAAGFGDLHNHPRAVGALDGKHVAIINPPNGGSLYYNYKNFYSIVLLGLVDPFYKFIAYDIGSEGRNPDSGIYNCSHIKRLIEEDLPYPPDAQLSTVGVVPYHVLADGGFAIGPRLLRPYPQRRTGVNMRESNFNNGHSKARRVVENAFGILSKRFRIMMTTQSTKLETTKLVVTACLCLHNLLPIPDMDDENQPLLPDAQPVAPFTRAGTATARGNIVRNRMTDYFN